MQLDLVSFVEEPTWKDLLLQLVSEHNLNPWEMDLGVIAEEYLKLVKQMKLLDLRIPANVLLASAILYRFKTEGLKEIEEPLLEEPEERILINEEIPDLIFKENQARKRTLTLDELVSALENVIKNPIQQRILTPMPTQLTLTPPEEDMGQRMKAFYQKINETKDSEGLVLFSQVVDRERFLSHSLLPMLHLVQEKKIHVWQEKLFDEIFISTKLPAEEPETIIETSSKKKAS
ncbi:Segregation and condensation protein A [uncultured archaeon]|nr:Segregation and condensation protein A [uncultured archaeon]